MEVLSAVVLKQSESGLTEHKRLLVLKRGLLFYYSKVPSSSGRDVDSLEREGILPKNFIQVSSLTKVEVKPGKGNVLTLHFEEGKLFSQDVIRKTILQQEFAAQQNSSSKLQQWTFTFQKKEIADTWQMALKSSTETAKRSARLSKKQLYRQSLVQWTAMVAKKRLQEDSISEADSECQEEPKDDIDNQQFSFLPSAKKTQKTQAKQAILSPPKPKLQKNEEVQIPLPQKEAQKQLAPKKSSPQKITVQKQIKLSPPKPAQKSAAFSPTKSLDSQSRVNKFEKPIQNLCCRIADDDSLRLFYQYEKKAIEVLLKNPHPIQQAGLRFWFGEAALQQDRYLEVAAAFVEISNFQVSKFKDFIVSGLPVFMVERKGVAYLVTILYNEAKHLALSNPNFTALKNIFPDCQFYLAQKSKIILVEPKSKEQSAPVIGAAAQYLPYQNLQARFCNLDSAKLTRLTKDSKSTVLAGYVYSRRIGQLLRKGAYSSEDLKRAKQLVRGSETGVFKYCLDSELGCDSSDQTAQPKFKSVLPEWVFKHSNSSLTLSHRSQLLYCRTVHDPDIEVFPEADCDELDSALHQFSPARLLLYATLLKKYNADKERLAKITQRFNTFVTLGFHPEDPIQLQSRRLLGHFWATLDPEQAISQLGKAYKLGHGKVRLQVGLELTHLLVQSKKWKEAGQVAKQLRQEVQPFSAEQTKCLLFQLKIAQQRSLQSPRQISGYHEKAQQLMSKFELLGCGSLKINQIKLFSSYLTGLGYQQFWSQLCLLWKICAKDNDSQILLITFALRKLTGAADRSRVGEMRQFVRGLETKERGDAPAEKLWLALKQLATGKVTSSTLQELTSHRDQVQAGLSAILEQY